LTKTDTVIRPLAGIIELAEQREFVMSLLEHIVEAVSQWGPQRDDDRKQCIALLQQLTDNIAAAIKIWEELEREAPVSRDKFTALLSIGAERSKTLYRIYQDQKDTGGQLSSLTGIPLRDTLGLSDEIDVVQAYGQLQADETIAEKAQTALATMKERQERIDKAIESLSG
jgi:hypothetical protein